MIPTTDFSIRSLLGGFDKNFTYVVTCSRTGAQLIVDAAIKFNRISPLIHNQPWAMLLTHTLATISLIWIRLWKLIQR